MRNSNVKSSSCRILIAFYGDKKMHVKKQITGENGHILIFDTEIENSEYILINLM